ncbi:hypothetical protein [Salipaludibacillus aurantiacus]|uniref:Uncharacterized protein n=1 Tax=Salipaludibacillus aurantiacus TaxID=1601833 RepID=A0A1H9S6M2_9BACI|nr:hypothetical protein [Salipaludibacillus aurantiacus]SER80275.1 hypothetical protein SAMN05518684_10438 [Salipaludibacillus aurantiacus]
MLIKTMLFWFIVFPLAVTALLIIFDYFLGQPIEAVSYLPNLLGLATGGLIIGFVMYQVKKLKYEQ